MARRPAATLALSFALTLAAPAAWAQSAAAYPGPGARYITRQTLHVSGGAFPS